MSKIAVIGSGFSSLAASCYLAQKGYEVTVFEKNESLGGRASQFKDGSLSIWGQLGIGCPMCSSVFLQILDTSLQFL